MPKRKRRTTTNDTPQPPAAPPPGAPPPSGGGQGYRGPALARFAGAAEARKWAERLLRDVGDFLAGRIPWTDVDRGAVFVGPPGCGKTMLVHAIAESIGVPLIATSYGDWMSTKDGHQGDMMRAMKDVFERAGKHRVAIVFIDELDSMPTRSGASEHKEWYTSAINALLEQLDGTRRRDGIIVIGACNDGTRIDPALARPGRLERKIVFHLPSTDEACQILDFHSGGRIPKAELERIAILATGSSGAEIEILAREGRRLARQAGRNLTVADLRQAALGAAGDIPTPILRRTATHEAGHAVVALRLGVAHEVAISIVRRADTLGATRIERIIEEQTREALERQIAVNLAGRAAEDILLGAPSSGSGGGIDSDLARATEEAVRYVAAYGLSRSNSLVWHSEPLREQILLTNPKIAEEVSTLLDRCYRMATEIIRSEGEGLARIVAALVDKRGLRHSEIADLLGKPTARPGSLH